MKAVLVLVGSVLLLGLVPIAPAAAAPTGGAVGGGSDDEVFRHLALPRFPEGVYVAAGDVNGDGCDDIITGAKDGMAPVVKVFSGANGTLLTQFLAFAPEFRGGVRVGAGDLNGDGKSDIIVGAGPGGGPHVRVVDAVTLQDLHSFFAFGSVFDGGVHVAAGDVTGDGRADVVTGAGAGGGPHVRVFDGVTGAPIRSFFAYGLVFNGGVNVAAADFNGDRLADIVTGAGAGGGPHVRVINSVDLQDIHSFFAFAGGFSGGVFVAAGDLNHDGKADIVTGAGPGGGPHVRVFEHQTLAPLASFFAFAPVFNGGVRVAVGDMKGNQSNDIVAAAGPGGGAHVRAFDMAGHDVFSFFAY